MDRTETVCFSGYRPDKLPDFGNETAFSVTAIKNDLHDSIAEAVSRGFDTFLVGMADGFDMFAAETVLELRKVSPYINNDCRLTFN